MNFTRSCSEIFPFRNNTSSIQSSLDRSGFQTGIQNRPDRIHFSLQNQNPDAPRVQVSHVRIHRDGLIERRSLHATNKIAGEVFRKSQIGLGDRILWIQSNGLVMVFNGACRVQLRQTARPAQLVKQCIIGVETYRFGIIGFSSRKISLTLVCKSPIRIGNRKFRLKLYCDVEVGDKPPLQSALLLEEQSAIVIHEMVAWEMSRRRP